MVILSGLASGDGIDVIFAIPGVSLRVSFCFDAVLGYGLIYFINLKSRLRNTTRIHNSGLPENLGAPVCAPK